jgi:hypothetical protein
VDVKPTVILRRHPILLAVGVMLAVVGASMGVSLGREDRATGKADCVQQATKYPNEPPMDPRSVDCASTEIAPTEP